MNANTANSTMSWLAQYRAEANRALVVAGGVALALAALAPAIGVVRAVTAFVWFGVLLLVLALPWTEWAKYETSEAQWVRRDTAVAPRTWGF